MKYVLAKLDVCGDVIGFWAEEYDEDNGTLHGKVVKGIQESDAKIYYNYEDARANCELISNKCDLLLRVSPYYDETSIYNDKKDYHELQRIVSKYPVEDIAKVISYALMHKESVKLANELNYLNAGLRNGI